MVSNPQVSTQQFDFIQGNLTTRADYDTSGNLVYTAWAAIGSLSSDPYWRIMKSNYVTINNSNYFSYTSFPCDINGNPSCGFAFVWDDRASLSYL